jgi:acetylglutamate kinase
MMEISKLGNQALRTVLVHGGRSVLRSAVNKDDPLSVWVNEIRVVMANPIENLRRTSLLNACEEDEQIA